MERSRGGTEAPGLANLAVPVAGCWPCWRLEPARALAAPSEYQVKAVFLFNFAQFVDWPAEAFPRPDAPFVIGILGEDPFGAQLDDVVRGETVNKRPLVIERYRSVAEIRNCNILFIGGNEGGHLDEILMALKGRSILTVGDADAAATARCHDSARQREQQDPPADQRGRGEGRQPDHQLEAAAAR